jgi:hypothetical protein
MARKPQDWEAGIGRIRQLLSRLLRECAQSREPVAEIIEILEDLDSAWRSRPTATGAAEAGSPEPRHRRNKPKQYKVERHGNVWYLAEHREGGRQADLCPKEVYEALATEMAGIAEASPFAALLQRVSDRMETEIPEYLVRLCIRFWMTTEPPLVEKVRTRYRAIRPSRMLAEARRTWRQLGGQVS